LDWNYCLLKSSSHLWLWLFCLMCSIPAVTYYIYFIYIIYTIYKIYNIKIYINIKNINVYNIYNIYIYYIYYIHGVAKNGIHGNDLLIHKGAIFFRTLSTISWFFSIWAFRSWIVVEKCQMAMIPKSAQIVFQYCLRVKVWFFLWQVNYWNCSNELNNFLNMKNDTINEWSNLLQCTVVHPAPFCGRSPTPALVCFSFYVSRATVEVSGDI